MKFFPIILSLVLLLPNFLWVKPHSLPSYNKVEQYDPALARLNSIRALTLYADSIAGAKFIKPNSLDYALVVTGVIRHRFFHGFSYYSFKENWLAASSEMLFGHNLASIVDPERIVKFPYGGCSQQAIVFMEVMKRKGFDYRSVCFPHHYASEIRIGHDWYYFDPNMEPHIPAAARLEARWLNSIDSLKQYYSRSQYPNVDWILGDGSRTRLSEVNASLAGNARIFHSITGLLSRILWIFPVCYFLYRRRKPAHEGSSNYFRLRLPSARGTIFPDKISIQKL